MPPRGMCTCPLGRTRRACARVRAHGALELRHIAHICVMQIVRARGANPIGRSQGGGVSRNPRFWGSREQRMRHVARMPDHAHRFVNYLYRYRFLSQLLIAPIEARRGMHHAMSRKAVFRTCGCPKTPFWRKLSARRPEKVFRYLHNHWI